MEKNKKYFLLRIRGIGISDSKVAYYRKVYKPVNVAVHDFGQLNEITME